MTYPATTYAEGVELAITSGNQLHEIINGDATEEINTESGMVPSVRKALADSMLFKPVIAWEEGSVESDPFQTRLYEEGIYWAPAASIETPISMGTNPNTDGNWFLAPVTVDSTSTSLTAIARSLNVQDNEVILSDNTTTSLDDVLYIYDASAQTTLGKPSDVGSGEYIVSVVDDVLTTGVGSYDLVDFDGGSVIATGSTTVRTLSDRFADNINARDFGAKGDGVTDDSTAINNAITFCNSIGGGTVLVSRNTNITSPIFILENVTLDFDGNTLFTNVHNLSSVYLRALYNVNRNFNSHLKNVNIVKQTGSTGTNQRDRAAVSLYAEVENPFLNGDTNHTGELFQNSLSNISISGNFHTGIYLGKTTFVERSYHVNNITIDGSIYAIYTDDYCEYVAISDSTVQNAQYGIYDNGASNIGIFNNQLCNNEEAGIYMSTTGRNTKKFNISGNTLNHNKRGVWVGSGIGSKGIPITECIINNNMILANTAQGIVASRGSYIECKGNMFSGNNISDIQLTATCRQWNLDNTYENSQNTAGLHAVLVDVGSPSGSLEDHAYHIINGNYKGYDVPVSFNFPQDPVSFPFNVASCIVNNSIEYYNGSGNPPSKTASLSQGNIDTDLIPFGCFCVNNVDASGGEVWLCVKQPSQSGVDGGRLFTRIV